MTQDAKLLLQKIRALDLAILDCGLYLNAYPSDEAYSYHQALVKERVELARQYQKSVAPLVKTELNAKNAWTDTPWPWELEAN